MSSWSRAAWPISNLWARSPVALTAGGSATLNATVSGNLSAPRIAGRHRDEPLSARKAAVHPVLGGAYRLALERGAYGRGGGARPLQMQLSASAGLRDWKPLPTSPLRADATIRNADVKDVLALAGESLASGDRRLHDGRAYRWNHRQSGRNGGCVGGQWLDRRRKVRRVHSAGAHDPSERLPFPRCPWSPELRASTLTALSNIR